LAGLQTGLIDAVAVPPIVALALQWHNHVKYVTRLPLMYIYSMMAIDKKAFESISAADQLVVREVLNRVFSEVDADNRRDNVKAYNALLAQGIQEVEPSAEQLLAWRAQADQSVIEISGDGISQASLDIFQQYLREYRQLDQSSAAQ